MRDTRVRKEYPGLKPVRVSTRDSRAELCAPITLEGRIIGTLNLESSHSNAYAHLVPLVEACAAQVALQLLEVRRGYSREILASREIQQFSTHELTGLAEDLEKTLAADIQTDSLAYTSLRTAIEVLDEVNHFGSSPKGGGGYTGDLAELVQQEAAKAKPKLRLQMSNQSTTAEIDWPAAFAQRARLALREILRNVRLHRQMGADGMVYFRTRQVNLGGLTHAELILEHRYPLTNPPNVARLYRAPLIRRDRPHFGALTAAVLVRSMGGDIFTSVRRDRRTVYVIMSLPSGANESGVA